MSAGIRKALEALTNGQLTVPIDAAVPLKQVSDAFERITQRSVRGNLVLDTAG
jgi:D-arabinose 1-dehydrogenase-like Zn-dependent alcohol dehydrogenase